MKKELVNLTNGYIANVGVAYIKLHNLHWNVVGGQFKAVHEYTESIYDALADVLDEVAEVLKMHGEMPLASLKDYLAAATIDELGSKELSVKDTLDILLADLKTLQAQADAIRTMADADGNYHLVAVMEDNLSNYAKNIWFVSSMLK
ncbi:MAG: DNA starvation/stationary phase protection protein [Firmicutes bacterium]|nr:DNA starvation/stationary phase protection protein [Bacillota bacterium]